MVLRRRTAERFQLNANSPTLPMPVLGISPWCSGTTQLAKSRIAAREDWLAAVSTGWNSGRTRSGTWGLRQINNGRGGHSSDVSASANTSLKLGLRLT